MGDTNHTSQNPFFEHCLDQKVWLAILKDPSRIYPLKTPYPCQAVSSLNVKSCFYCPYKWDIGDSCLVKSEYGRLALFDEKYVAERLTLAQDFCGRELSKHAETFFSLR